MNLRVKALVIVSAVMAVLGLALHVGISASLTKGFTRLEEEDMRQHVRLVLDLINDELTTLDFTANDWGAWDDTYAYIQDRNEAYASSNLSDDTVARLKFNLMVYATPTGEVVFARGLTTTGERVEPVPASFLSLLRLGSLLLSPDLSDGLQGVVALPEGIALVAARAMLTSKGEGPSRGALIFGRFMTAERIEAIAKRAQAQVELRPVASAQGNAAGIQDMPEVTVRGEDVLAGRTVIPDLFGTPALEVRVEMARPVYRQARATAAALTRWRLAMWVVAALVLMLVLDRLVLRRVDVLAGEATRMAEALAGTGASLAQSEARYRDALMQKEQDATQRKQLEEVAKRQAEQLQQANQTLQEKLEDLRRINETMMGREERILELKAQLKALQAQTGATPT